MTGRRWLMMLSIAAVMMGKATGTLFAQGDGASGGEAKRLDEITVTGEREGAVAPLEEIPGTVNIITQQEIERAHAKNTDELLRRIPGIHIVEEHGQGLRPNVGIRGLDPIRSRNVLVLVDGVPIQPAMYGDAAMYYNIPIEQVERIEVIKGGASVLYSPNTQGGVINYITKKLPDAPVLSLKETIGSRRFLSSELSYGGRSGNKGIQLSYLRRQGDGFRDRSAFWLNDIGLRLEANPDINTDIAGKISWYNEEAETPGGISPAQFNADLTKAGRQFDLFLGQRASFDLAYTSRLNADNAVRFLVYGNFFERNWFIQDRDAATGTLKETNAQFRRKFNVLGFEPEWRRNYALFGQNHDVVTGLRIYLDRETDVRVVGATPAAMSGKTTQDADLETVAYSAYLETNFHPTKRLTLTPGIRWESVNLSRENLNPSPTSTAPNFKNSSTFRKAIYGIGAAYQAASETMIFGHLHTTFRPPTFAQAVDPTTGTDTDLNAEVGLSSDIGVRSRIFPWLSTETSLFRLTFDNQVISENGKLVNGGKTFHQGVEGSLTLDWGRLWIPAGGLTSRLNVTLLEAEQRSGATSGKDLPLAPRVLLGWGIGYLHPTRVSVDLDGTLTGKRFTDAANTEAENALGTLGAIPSYMLWNLRVAYAHPKYPLSVFGGVRNLFDEHFIAERNAFFVGSGGIHPGETRNFYAGASYAY